MTQNLLDRETSPYLLQHKDNPVHWRPWGPAAFNEAQLTHRPILLSVGYAACHWCHVMAHESFEDQNTANIMNQAFVSIKVDREERPDVDKVYMDALHALGEQGGWPLTMFLTPEGEPFWGGTYFPPEPRYGRPSFTHVLTEISRIWTTEPDKITTNTRSLRSAIEHKAETSTSAEPSIRLLHDAARLIARAVDPQTGGLKGAPKFPQAPIFSFLWDAYIRERDPALIAAISTTLTSMCQGGIYDHLGGGLSRYAVDSRWLIPHFEKMLYDNAQFVSLLSRVWTFDKSPLFRQRIEETIDFVLSDMTTADGAFAASYDADSEGHEGKYYVWTSDEIDTLLDHDAHLFKAAYGVTPSGNWEGTNIINRLDNPKLHEQETEATLAASRARLLAHRRNRIPPGYDDKVLADWNGLMIAALAEAAMVLNRADWLQAATRAFDRILELHWKDGSLFHAYRAGQLRGLATADDYAHLITAALALHAATAAATYIDTARQLTGMLIRDYSDENTGAFYFTSVHTTDLIVRPGFVHDDATPNATGIMQRNLAILGVLTGNEAYTARATRIMTAYASTALANPFAHPSLLSAALNTIDQIQVIVTAVDQADMSFPPMITLIQSIGPGIALGHVNAASKLPQSHPAHGKAAARMPQLYLCRGNTCAAPAATPEETLIALETLRLKPA